MLAVVGEPFDSVNHFFEFKWDGFRTGAYIENGVCRLMSRRAVDMTRRFAVLSKMASLPEGTILDGEVVLFVDGKPLFEGLLESGRKQRSGIIRYIAFDILYRAFTSVMDLPFSTRRVLLEDIATGYKGKELLLSEGLSTYGTTLYEKARILELEGVMAKRISSVYTAGKRSESWIKIKRRLITQVVIIGYVEKGKGDFKSILVAGNGVPGRTQKDLHYMGKVGGGFTDEMKKKVNRLLRERGRSQPIVSCPERACWVEPIIFCNVSFTELTTQGLFRAPVFEGLVEGS